MKSLLGLAKSYVVTQDMCRLEGVELLTSLCDLCSLLQTTRDGCLATTHDM